MKPSLMILLASSLSILSEPMAFLMSSVLKYYIYQYSFATGSTSLSLLSQSAWRLLDA